MYSTTKYIGGHGFTSIGRRGDRWRSNFDWEAHPTRQPLTRTRQIPATTARRWRTWPVKPPGPIAYILKMRVTLLRDLGAAMNFVQRCFLFLQGVETLALRMRAHSDNTLAVANYLAERKGVSRVIHPSRHTGVGAQRTAKYLSKGMGGMCGFELAGGVDAGRKFIDSLKMFYHVANIGDARSLAIHPASTTHSQLTEAEQAATGVTPGYACGCRSQRQKHIDAQSSPTSAGRPSPTRRERDGAGRAPARRPPDRQRADGGRRNGFSDSRARAGTLARAHSGRRNRQPPSLDLVAAGDAAQSSRDGTRPGDATIRAAPMGWRRGTNDRLDSVSLRDRSRFGGLRNRLRGGGDQSHTRCSGVCIGGERTAVRCPLSGLPADADGIRLYVYQSVHCPPDYLPVYERYNSSPRWSRSPMRSRTVTCRSNGTSARKC